MRPTSFLARSSTALTALLVLLSISTATLGSASDSKAALLKVRDIDPHDVKSFLETGAGLLGVSPDDPLGVATALQSDAPLLDLSQMLDDLTPKRNTSLALTEACSDINRALPDRDFFDSFSLSPQYKQSTQHYFNARQAAPRVTPACVIYPQTGKDVQTIMKALRRQSTTYAVRGAGGHSTGYNFTTALGFSSTTGVLIDMSAMQALSYDASTGIARWELGYTWGGLSQAMEQYSAQVAGGRLGAVGPGLLLGGGVSWFSGKVGFASDTVEAYEIVLADGRLVTATRDNEFSDLFWAQKVGLNAFGIVTAVSSKTIPVKQIYGSSRLFLSVDMPGVLGALAKWYQTGADACPDGYILPAIVNVLVNSAITRLNIFEFFYNGPQADADKCFADFAQFKPLYQDSKMRGYTDFMLNALTNQNAVFEGFANALYSMVTETPSAKTLVDIYYKWEEVSSGTDLTFLQRTLTFGPVTRTQLAASKAAGGSPLGVENDTQGFVWVGLADSSLGPGSPTDTRLFASAKQVDAVVPKSTTRQLPLYINYARLEQQPLLSFRPESLEKYRAIKRKYDPDGFITSHTTGHVFY